MKIPYVRCICIYKTFVDESVSTWSTVLELIFTFIIGTCGVILNYMFLKKLQAEKKSRLLGRKGNVVEPIMSWFCVFQIIYWPYYLVQLWILSNGIIPPDCMNGWWCPATVYSITFGRIIIGYNSLFVAFIRYLYIVHHQKSNQWEFERVAKIFQISSFVIPLAINVIDLFTNSHQSWLQNMSKFTECVAFSHGVNSTENFKMPKALTVEWTMNYLPEWILNSVYYVLGFIQVIVLFNILEGVLYFQIHRSIKR